MCKIVIQLIQQSDNKEKTVVSTTTSSEVIEDLVKFHGMSKKEALEDIFSLMLRQPEAEEFLASIQENNMSWKKDQRVYHRNKDLLGTVAEEGEHEVKVKYDWPYDPDAPPQRVIASELISEVEIRRQYPGVY